MVNYVISYTWKGATALKLHLKPKLLSVVPSYNRDFLVPLYNCTTVVKLKLAITLATDQLKTYNLHFQKWQKKFFSLASAGFEPATCSGRSILQYFWDLDAKWPRLYFEEFLLKIALFCCQNGQEGQAQGCQPSQWARWMFFKITYLFEISMKN